MATDPVPSIQHETADHPFVGDLRDTRSRLVALPPSIVASYLTLSLDWRPEGVALGGAPPTSSSSRSDRVRTDCKPHAPAHDSGAADLERIEAYLDSDVDPATQGLAIIAGAARDVFTAVPLPVPVASRLITSVTPAC